MTNSERKEWGKYSKIQGNNLSRCKVNELVIFPNNTKGHELGKFHLYWKLRKEKHNVITECYLKNERCDLVDLTDGERYEIETTEKRAARFKGLPINVIMVDINGNNC